MSCDDPPWVEYQHAQLQQRASGAGFGLSPEAAARVRTAQHEAGADEEHSDEMPSIADYVPLSVGVVGEDPEVEEGELLLRGPLITGLASSPPLHTSSTWWAPRDASGEARVPASPEAPPPKVAFRTGERVCAAGLKARPELNGMIGTVLNYDADAGRFGVAIHIGGFPSAHSARYVLPERLETVRIKASNLRAASPVRSALAGASASPPGSAERSRRRSASVAEDGLPRPRSVSFDGAQSELAAQPERERQRGAPRAGGSGLRRVPGPAAHRHQAREANATATGTYCRLYDDETASVENFEASNRMLDTSYQDLYGFESEVRASAGGARDFEIAAAFAETAAFSTASSQATATRPAEAAKGDAEASARAADADGRVTALSAWRGPIPWP